MTDQNGPYFEVTQEAGRDFMMRGIQGEVVMLNLIRFRGTADYSATPDLEPDTLRSGAEAYEIYMRETLPLLREAGGDVVFLGDGGPFLIGPPDERWDLVLLVRHRSVEAFMAFASDDAYQSDVLGHRLAAIADSRLLPIVAREDQGVEPVD